jgi:CRISPR/Cas system Type II protein with McrA/HNH and RuvC-like nuclease domain
MKYIHKNNEKSIAAAAKLHHWRDHFEQNGRNFKEIAQEMTPEEAWKLIDTEKGLKTELRKALYSEQEGVCCYCVQELVLGTDLQTTSTVIEHFLPKSADIEANTYNYKNLLLSCDGNNGVTRNQNIKFPKKELLGKILWQKFRNKSRKIQILQ